MNGHQNGQYSGFSDMGQSKQHGSRVGGNSLSMSDPWSSHWAVHPGGPAFPNPPPSARYNGLSLPSNPQGHSTKEKRSKGGKTGRSVSCVTEPWSALMGVAEVGEGGGQAGGKGVVAAAGTDLLQLMKSLDIGSEHMQSLKVESFAILHPRLKLTVCMYLLFCFVGTQVESAATALHV